MELTERESIERSKEEWGWLAETGEEKEDWPGWEKCGHILFDCFLCERGKNKVEPICAYCPLHRKPEIFCYDTPYLDWEQAKTKKDKRKYAKLFLEVLETL